MSNFDVRLLIPVSSKMRDALRVKAGNLKMAEVVRELIRKYLENGDNENGQANDSRTSGTGN